MPEPKKLFIIGNGFDLSLGLKTSYSDFIESQNFKKLLAGNNILAKYLKEKHSQVNWIDIELELALYSKSRITDSDTFESEYNDLCYEIFNYLSSSLDTSEVKKNSKAFLLLQKELSDDSKNFLIIDFNYTSTLENIFKSFGFSDADYNSCVVKIHGDLKNKNIILGVHDNSGRNEDDLFIQKSGKSNFNKQKTKISQEMTNSEKIIIFGHSLGETDSMYFRDFFNHLYKGSKPKDMVIYFSGKKDRGQIIKRVNKMCGSGLSDFKEFITIDEQDVEK